jgi:nicotinamide-nucleotide adenylyltransferase
MKKYKTGLIIGRFQPLHKGHLFLIKQALKLADTIIIGIGSANVIDFNNPYSVEEREETLRNALEKEQRTKYVQKIIRLDDYHNDTIWLKETLEKTGSVDIVIGNNDWVNSIFKNAGYETQSIPYYRRNIYEGRKIRARMRKLHQLPNI